MYFPKYLKSLRVLSVNSQYETFLSKFTQNQINTSCAIPIIFILFLYFYQQQKKTFKPLK